MRSQELSFGNHQLHSYLTSQACARRRARLRSLRSSDDLLIGTVMPYDERGHVCVWCMVYCVYTTHVVVCAIYRHVVF